MDSQDWKPCVATAIPDVCQLFLKNLTPQKAVLYLFFTIPRIQNHTKHQIKPYMNQIQGEKWSGIGGILKSDQIPHTCLLWKNSDTPDAGYSSMSSDHQAKRSGRQCTSQAERI